MKDQALGLIEVRGLVAATEAADTAVKTAGVDILGYELTKGSGWVVLKIAGEVSAVTAALAAAEARAKEISAVFATRVIARPHRQVGERWGSAAGQG